MHEYSLKIKAENLKRIDKQRDLHWSAFLNRAVQATDKKGQYIYKEFKDFFAEQRLFDKIDDKKQEVEKVKRKRMAQIALEINKKGGSV